MADLQFYDGACLVAAAKAGSRANALRRAPPAAAASLLAAFARLRHADEPLLDAFCKTLPEMAPALPPARLAEALWAPLALGYSGRRLDVARGPALAALAARAERLDAGAAARALWCVAALGDGAPTAAAAAAAAPSPAAAAAAAADAEASAALAQRLVTALAGAAPADLSFEELLLLHQAARLLGHDPEEAAASGAASAAAAAASGGAGAQDVLAAAAGCGLPEAVEDGEASSSDAQGDSNGAVGLHADDDDRLAFQDISAPPAASPAAAPAPPGARPPSPAAALPRRLLRAAAAAARDHAAANAGRRRQVEHVVDILEDAGLGPVTGLPLDRGALLIDVAVTAGPLKVAVMCDGPGRATRSAPHGLTGYWAAGGALLARRGWRVVRLPWYEWDVVAEGGGDPHAPLMHVYNAFAAQGVPL
jgi:hypothetical protein